VSYTDDSKEESATRVHYIFMSIRQKKEQFKGLTCASCFLYATSKIHAATMGQAGLGITEISNKKCNCLIFREL